MSLIAILHAVGQLNHAPPQEWRTGLGQPQILTGSEGCVSLIASRAKWLKLVTEFDRLFTSVVGRTEKVLERAQAAGRRWYHGQVACREAFG